MLDDANRKTEVLSHFSECILQLREMATSIGPERLLEETIEQLKRYLRFGSAWWGEVPGATTTPPPAIGSTAAMGLAQSSPVSGMP